MHIFMNINDGGIGEGMKDRGEGGGTLEGM